MTDDEAKRMWCPFTRATEGHMDHATGIAPGYAGCLGSKCMAWRRSAETGVGYCGMAGTPTS